MADKISPQGYVIGLMPTNQNPFWGDDVPTGQGIPAGGNTGDVLTKKSDADYDAEWAPGGGGVPGPQGPAGADGKNAVKHMFSTDSSVTLTNDGTARYNFNIGNIWNGYTCDITKLIDITIYFAPQLYYSGQYITFGNITLSYKYNLINAGDNNSLPVVGSDGNLYVIKHNLISVPTAKRPAMSIKFEFYQLSRAGTFDRLVASDQTNIVAGVNVAILEEA